MDESSLVLLGQIVKTHGVKGTFVIQTENPSVINEDTELLVVDVNSQRIPFFIVHQSYKAISADSCFVTLDDIPTKEEATELLNCDVYVEKTPETEQSETHIDFKQIINFTVFDELHGEIGRISNWYNIPQNPLLEVDNQGRKVLLPANKETILSIDIPQKHLLTSLPDGILKIN